MSRTSLYFLRDRAPDGAGCAAMILALRSSELRRLAENPFSEPQIIVRNSCGPYHVLLPTLY